MAQMGKLLVVTGFSGSGKDAIIEEILIRDKSFRRLVTCTDRPPRPGEIHGKHYYFCTSKELSEMYDRHELVEKPLLYGSSRKATPKKEFKKIINEGASLIWRIESSLSAQVASGKFFDEQFSPKDAQTLKKSTTVVFITAPKKTLVSRRKRRDGKNYEPKEFAQRDRQDAAILTKYGRLFSHIVNNEENKLSEATGDIIKLLELE